MSDIQDEAYSEAMDEIKRLKAQFQKAKGWNQFSEIQIKNLEHTTTDLQRECENRGSKIAELERLVIRAADALEGWSQNDTIAQPLIAELRHAAE